MQKIPNTQKKDVVDGKTSPKELKVWCDWIEDLRSGGYNENSVFFLAYSKDYPITDAEIIKEYFDEIEDIYDPAVGDKKTLVKIPKDHPEMFMVALQDTARFRVREDGGVKEIDIGGMTESELVEFAFDYYDKIQNEPLLCYENELERNYGDKIPPDYTGKVHSASEELTEEERYL